jgi:hypothetical protein
MPSAQASLSQKGERDRIRHLRLTSCRRHRLNADYHPRFRPHMDVEITIDDPEMYTKPFTIKVTHVFQADTDILEYFCNENEKDRGHMGR